MIDKLLIAAALGLSLVGVMGSQQTQRKESVQQLLLARPGSYSIQARVQKEGNNEVTISDGSNVLSAYGRIDKDEEGLANITVSKSGTSYRITKLSSTEDKNNPSKKGILCDTRVIGNKLYGAVDVDPNSSHPCAGEQRYIHFSEKGGIR